MAPVEKLWGHLLCPFETCPAAGWGSEGFTALFPLQEAQIPVLQFVETLGTYPSSFEGPNEFRALRGLVYRG
jgi:hypothetical protein